MFGKEWKAVAEYMGTRTRPQIASRIQQLKIEVKKNPSTKGFDVISILNGIKKRRGRKATNADNGEEVLSLDEEAEYERLVDDNDECGDADQPTQSGTQENR